MKKPSREQVIAVCNRFALLLHAVACFAGYFLIEAISRHSLREAAVFLDERTKVFLFNTFLIWVTTLVVFLVRRRVFLRILIASFWMMLGVINGMLLANRVTPFTGPDLKLLKEGLGIFNKYLSPALAVLAIAAVLILIAFIVFMMFRAPKYQGKMHYKWYIPGIICAILAFAGTTRFCIEQRILSTYFGNIASAYEDYGYPYCLAVTIFDTGVDKPNGYSEELIDGIMAEVNEASYPEGDLPNIVAIQLESFFDPTKVRFLEFSEDPIPNFRQLMKEYSSGYYTVPSVGAGTANTEFETLTGMSMRYFGPGEYPYKGILLNNTCESIANVLSGIGYSTHAIHNNEANFYSRRIVYSQIGFNSFTSAEYMDTQDDINPLGWMRDENLIKYIESALDSSDNQDLVFTVSVQGHGAYPEEPMYEDPQILVSGAESDEANCKWEYYVNEIYEMDQFVYDLIQMLEAREEPTVLLLYGDHLPTMGLTELDLMNYNLFQTEYVIWDNIGLERKVKNICAYQIMAEILDRLDIHEGTLFRFHQDMPEDEEYQLNLQTLQYDMLYGKQYVYEQTNPFSATLLRLGVKAVRLNRIEMVGQNMYYIYGENFTQSSKLRIEGEVVENTEFIDSGTLFVKEADISSGDWIDVAQQSNSSTAKVLSHSNTLIYRVPGVEAMMQNAVSTAEQFLSE
ncbi:MAG: LTA synthase family protein [Lachnospiraceae bacterium]|nr:LTA synthase family protein [Lachnospiraceae bacterium]